MRIPLLLALFLLVSPNVWGAEKCSSALIKAMAGSPLTKTQILEKLKALSPELTAVQVKAKISAAQDPFHLYRSFVPAYYDALQEGVAGNATLKQLGKETGWIFGDVHPENFGVQLSDHGKAVFTMNDLDDGARGPLQADLIRFLASVNLYDKDIELSSVLKSYRAGLAGDDLPKSKVIKNMKVKAEDAGRAPPAKLYDADSKTLIQDKETQAVRGARRTEIEKAVTDAYGKDVEVQDVLAVTRDEGGSGGLKRYRVLVRLAEKEGTEKHHVVIEFKEMIDASIKPFTDIRQPSLAERIQAGLKNTQPGDPSHFFATAKVDGEQMMLRPRFAGNVGVRLQDLSAKEAEEVILYESALLGQLHGASADSSKVYLKELGKVSDDVFTSESQRIAGLFRDYFRVLKAE